MTSLPPAAAARVIAERLYDRHPLAPALFALVALAHELADADVAALLREQCARDAELAAEVRGVLEGLAALLREEEQEG